ncbi:hypothetical protein AB0F45_17595 [Streptomyces achromogenes]|uniref:hypothetical protein n=1 Tax=Streptomyces achromogenes TaxID=67255 RepID=UPI0033C05E0A
MSQPSRSVTTSRWRRRPDDAVPQSAANSPLCDAPSHPQLHESTPPGTARRKSLFEQRTLVVLCAAVTIAHIAGAIAAYVSGNLLTTLTAGVFAFGGTITFFHEHTD